MTINKPEVVGFATHHDEPMLFPSKREAAMYCDDGEEPVALIRLSDYEDLQAEQVPDAIQLLQRVAASTIDKPAVAVPEVALAMLNKIIAELEGGFVACQRCGDQEETAILDCMYDLKNLRNLLAAAPSHSQQSVDLIDEFATQLAEKFPFGMSAGDVFAEVKSFKLDRCPSHESEQDEEWTPEKSLDRMLDLANQMNDILDRRNRNQQTDSEGGEV